MKYIDDLIDNDDIDWYLHFRLSLFNKTNIDKNFKNYIDFISNKLTFTYSQDLCKMNPFNAMVVWKDGNRSINVEDLEVEDIKVIQELIPFFKSDIIKGRLCDILGIVTQLNEWKEKCEDFYLQYFQNNFSNLNPSKIIPPLKRALFLILSRKDIEKLKVQINKILQEKDFKDKNKLLIVASSIAEFLWQKQPKIFKNFESALENIVEKVDISNEAGLNLIESLIKYFKSIKNYEKIEKYEFLYVEICKKINEERMPHGYEFIKKAINILDDKYESKLDELRFILDETEKKLHDSLQYVPISIDNKITENLVKAQKQIIDILREKDSGESQFLFLLKEFRPMTISELTKQLKDKEKYVFTNLFNNVQFNKDKRIVYESAESTEDKKMNMKFLKYCNCIMI